MTTPQHMLWMLDEWETIHGHRGPGFITGKPVGMGGSLGRTEATGYGAVFTLREALKELGIDVAKTTASVQGFGNVAAVRDPALHEDGRQGRRGLLAGTRATRRPTRSARDGRRRATSS